MPKENKSTRTRRKPCRVRVPVSFDPKLHLPPELRKHEDSARYLLHKIIWGHVQRKQDLNDYVPLKFDYLREVIPDRVIKPLRLALEAAGVIQCDNHYIESHKSFGFRIGEQFQNDRIVEVAISNEVTAKKITNMRRSKERKIRLDVHCWLRSKFRDLDIDLSTATNILSSHRSFEAVKIPVEEIAAKDVAFSVCPYGRVHTPLTRLSKQVRRCLRVDGESLVNLDIANSQPLFLALLMMNYRKRGSKTYGYITFKDNTVNPYKDIDSIIEQTVGSFISKKENNSTTLHPLAITTRKASEKDSETLYLRALKTTSSCPWENTLNKKHLQQDELLFVELCEQGSLYKHLASVADVPVRDWVKQQLFEVLFSKLHFHSPFKSAFIAEFPHVMEVINAHKRKNHKHLAQLLQNIEANFIINNVCRKIMNEMPEAPIFTIHDSVLTTKQYVPQVNHIMEAEFASLGLTPRIKPEHYGTMAESDSGGPTESLVASVA